jgi:hypothetical protein
MLGSGGLQPVFIASLRSQPFMSGVGSWLFRVPVGALSAGDSAARNYLHARPYRVASRPIASLRAASSARTLVVCAASIESGQQHNRHDAPTPGVASARAPRTLVCGKGSVFSRQSFHQDLLVQRELGTALLEALVLALELLQPLGLIDLQAAVLTAPLVVGLLRRGGQFSAPMSASGAGRITDNHRRGRFARS